MAYRDAYRKALKKGDYSPLSHKIFKLGLNHKEIAVAAYLIDGGETFHPSTSRIIDVLKMNDGTLTKALRKLHQLKVIYIYNLNKRRVRYKYRINPAILWQESAPQNREDQPQNEGLLQQEHNNNLQLQNSSNDEALGRASLSKDTAPATPPCNANPDKDLDQRLRDALNIKKGAGND